MTSALLKMRNSVKGAGRAPGFVQTFCQENNVAAPVAADICIVLDELLPSLVTITVSPRIRLEIAATAEVVQVSVAQSGEAYDISDKAHVCWPAVPSERRISDLSLHLIHTLTETIQCSRINGENLTVFTKKLTAELPERQ